MTVRVDDLARLNIGRGLLGPQRARVCLHGISNVEDDDGDVATAPQDDTLTSEYAEVIIRVTKHRRSIPLRLFAQELRDFRHIHGTGATSFGALCMNLARRAVLWHDTPEERARGLQSAGRACCGVMDRLAVETSRFEQRTLARGLQHANSEDWGPGDLCDPARLAHGVAGAFSGKHVDSDSIIVTRVVGPRVEESRIMARGCVAVLPVTSELIALTKDNDTRVALVDDRTLRLQSRELQDEHSTPPRPGTGVLLPQCPPRAVRLLTHTLGLHPGDSAPCRVCSIPAVSSYVSVEVECGPVLATMPVSVLVCAPAACIAAEVEHRFWSTLHRLKGSLETGKVLPGAGVPELACAQALIRDLSVPPLTLTEVEARRVLSEALEDTVEQRKINCPIPSPSTSNLVLDCHASSRAAVLAACRFIGELILLQ